MRASGFAAANVNGKPASGGDAMPGRKCSPIDRRQKCDTRRRMEREGQAYWSMWDGLLFPVTRDVTQKVPFSWGNCCPFCGGEVRLGIRHQLDAMPPPWKPQPWTPDEGDE